MYEAMTTVINVGTHQHPPAPIADLVELAKGGTVLSRAADTLMRLHVTDDPTSVLKTIEVTEIKDTNILAIRVHSESEEVAKATADIVANEFIQYYDEFTGNKPGERALQVVDAAKTTPLPSSLRLFGLGPMVLALFAGLILVGVIIGMVFGYFIAKRARRKLPEPE